MAIKPGDMVIQVPIYWEFIGGSSKKFWEIGWIDEKTFVTMYGRIGSRGAQTKKSYHSKSTAQFKYKELLYRKIRKGYKQAERPACRMDINLDVNDTGYLLVTNVDGNCATCLNDAGDLLKINVRKLGVMMPKKE